MSRVVASCRCKFSRFPDGCSGHPSIDFYPCQPGLMLGTAHRMPAVLRSPRNRTSPNIFFSETPQTPTPGAHTRPVLLPQLGSQHSFAGCRVRCLVYVILFLVNPFLPVSHTVFTRFGGLLQSLLPHHPFVTVAIPNFRKGAQ
ncbi:hypothetical protein N656DRAFT_107235 [Canariomyces notabilis]|uniref:Uncharacterized protein n=1 Tax=Canariomyces notabilis TaxID=2074819 RepID=A0AAN6TCY8_9PEZI|nr:hypothetical protein N656DRAFT_107235 [Canariomyces arenarius]